MIRYDLQCDKAHRFESWFKDSAAFDDQAERGLLLCPHCASTQITKALMAPQLTRKSNSRSEAVAKDVQQSDQTLANVNPEAVELRRKLEEFRRYVVENSENVGQKFAEEARKIHYGETEARAIYGEASAEDAKELAEEGVEFTPLPWANRSDA